MGLIDELYDDKNFGQCRECGEDHVLCPTCGLCLKYCHDELYCADMDYCDPSDNRNPAEGITEAAL